VAPRATKPKSAPEQPAWKNPAWIAAIGGLVTAVATALGLIVSNLGDDGSAAPTVPTAVSTTSTTVARSVDTGGASDACGPATCEAFTATVQSFVNGFLLTNPNEADLQRADDLRRQKLEPWEAFTNDGPVDVGVNELEVVLAGRSDQPVVITRARVEVVAQTAIGSGVHVTYAGQGCGGPEEELLLQIRLDGAAPAIKASGRDASGKFAELPPPWSVTVSDTKPVTMHVQALAFEHDVQWRLVLDYSASGRTGTMRIDDSGKPFRVTGITAANPRYTVLETGGVERDSAHDGFLGSCFPWPEGSPPHF
jgi:hypothetical protein